MSIMKRSSLTTPKTLDLNEKGRSAPKTSPSVKRRMTHGQPSLRSPNKGTEMFQSIVELGNEGILAFDEQYRIQFANQMVSSITGYPNPALLKMTVPSLLGEHNRFLFQNLLGDPGRYAEEKACIEIELTTASGEAKEIELCLALAKDGGLKGYAYLLDITTREKCKRDLTESEEKLRTLFERVRHGLMISSKEGKFMDCNKALIDMLEYPNKEELLKIDFSTDLYADPLDRNVMQERVEREGYVKDFEVQFKKKNGERITVLLTVYPIKNEKGETVGYEGINLDITDRKRIENEFREAYEFFLNLIESSVDGIIAADMKGKIFIFNKGAEALTGYKAEEVIGKVHITEIYPKGMAKDLMNKLRCADYGGVGKLNPMQLLVLNRAGEEIPIQLSATLICDRLGKELASVGIFTDLRPRLLIEKKLEETHLQLVGSEKMASLGKLAAGIAHEINNPLGGILIYSSLMMEDLPESDPKRADLGRIVQEASRCKEIVKNLLEFARQTEPRMEPTDTNRAIKDVLFFLENQALFHNIQIIKKLAPSLLPVHGNAGQLKQVFMNILINAAEAMHGNGVLTIVTRPSFDRKTILIDFTDTGEGIPEGNLTRIFDPFFTTKEVGKGTGLGLATSYGIIESHEGKIHVRSKVGEGTTFTIELPLPSQNSSAKAGNGGDKQPTRVILKEENEDAQKDIAH